MTGTDQVGYDDLTQDELRAARELVRIEQSRGRTIEQIVALLRLRLRNAEEPREDEAASEPAEPREFKYPPPAPERIYGASDDSEFPRG